MKVYYYILAGGSIICNAIIKFLLRNTKSSTYTKLLNEIIVIESFYFYLRLLLPEKAFNYNKNATDIFILYLSEVIKKISNIFPPTIGENFVADFNFICRYSFEILLVFMNIELCFEMIIALQNPISEVKNRLRIYNFISIFIFVVMFIIASCCFSDNSYSLFYKISDITLIICFIGTGIISCILIIKQYYGKKSLFTTIFILRHVLYVFLFSSMFFPLKIYFIVAKEPSDNLIRPLLCMNLGTGIALFAIRFLETRVVIGCISRKMAARDNSNLNRISTLSSKSKASNQGTELSSYVQNNINLELMCCILYGLTEIYLQHQSIADIFEQDDYVPQQDRGRSTIYLQTGDTYNQSIKTLMEKYNVTKKDFKRIKLHKIKYSKPNGDYFDISEMKIQIINDNKAASISRISRLGLSFRPEQIDDTPSSIHDLSIITEEQSMLGDIENKNHDADLIEYFPNVFQIIRNNDDISNKMLGNSLNPNNNKNFVKSLVESKGKSGSFFFFSDDKRFIIKTINNAELENMLCNFMPNYFEYVVNNPETLIAKVYGIYTIAINEGSSKVHIILMQNLVTCKPNLLKLIFDLKGSTFQRFTKQIGQINPNRALKDLDFLWMKRVEKDLIQFSKDAKDNIYSQLESDVQMLSDNNLMDYSLLLVIFKFPPQEDQDYMDMVGLLGNPLYLNRTFKSNDMKYLYIIGIIDYLQDFNMRKFFEQKLKNVIYWKEGKNVSVQDPVTYSNRFLSFMKDNMLE